MKPWPRDAVMITAASWRDANRGAMEAVVPATCRACEASLAVDSRTIRAALAMPERMGRPVQFFCVPCCLRHDPRSVERVVDHRQPAE